VCIIKFVLAELISQFSSFLIEKEASLIYHIAISLNGIRYFLMQKKLVFTLLTIFCLPLLLFCQSREMGIMVGIMGYKGDLNPVMYSTKSIDPAIGILYRRCYSNHWAFKAGINYGHIHSNDADEKDGWSKNRNLMFKSHIIELTGQFEFNFFPYQTANPATRFTPFILGGLSIFHFNPKALYNGNWYEVQPLGTEGQGTPEYSDRKKYKRTSAAIAFGGGFKFKVGRRFGVTIESAVRRTYTDYLDDVSKTYADPKAIRKENGKTAAILSDRSIDQSAEGNIGRQRGDKAKKDWYVFTGVQVTYTLSKRYIDSCRPFRLKLW